MQIRLQILGILCICTCTIAFAQVEAIRYFHPLFSPIHAEEAGGARGVIRTLVVGIDRYQHAGFPGLDYARRDAEAFAAFLKTPAGGSVSGADLALLTNEEATLARVTDALDWMVGESRQGDKIIIFFSLYALPESRYGARLFFYDTPSGPTEAGYLELSQLATLLGTAANRANVRVFLAIDMRLVNPDPQKLENWRGSERRWGILNERLSPRPPVIIPDSTSGEKSFGKTLLNGLLGLADANADEKVYMPELLQYLTTQQKNALPASNVAFLAFSDAQDWVCKYSDYTREKLEQQGETSTTPILQLEVHPLDKFIAEKADQATRRLYEDFILTIRLGQLLPPPERCASALLDSLLQMEALAPVHKQLQRRMAVAYQDEAQQAINDYLQTSARELARRRKDHEHYLRYPVYMQKTLDILGDQHFMGLLLQLKQRYFEALALRFQFEQTKDSTLLPQAMSKLSQAIAIEPEASFLYNEMGVNSYFMHQYEAAENYFEMALERSPTWGIPKANWSLCLLRQGRLEEAKMAGLEAAGMNPWSLQPYYVLGEILLEMDSLHSAAAMFERALKIDPELPDAHYKLACIHARQGQPAPALERLGLALKYGFDDKNHLLTDRDLEPIRETAEFEKLLKKYISQRVNKE